jgi:hypothetical protein
MTITTVLCCGWKLYKTAGEMEDEEAEDAADTGSKKSGAPKPQTMGTTDLESGNVPTVAEDLESGKVPTVAEGDLPHPEAGMPQPRGDNATSEPTLQPYASRSISQFTPSGHDGCRMAPPWLNGWIAGLLGASDDKKTGSSDAVTPSSKTIVKV